MPNFGVRVELKGNPSYEQYETLHVVMASLGFLKTVDGYDTKQNPRRFDLPHAMYYGSSSASCAAVRDVVVEAVKAKVQKDIIVFVVEAVTWSIG